MKQSIVTDSPKQALKGNKPVDGALGKLRAPSVLRNKVVPTLAALAAGVQMTKGAIILTEANIPGHQALGNQYPGALFGNARFNDGTTTVDFYFSGGFIGRNDAQGYSYFVLPAHDALAPNVSITSVGFGSSVNTPSGYLPNVSLVYAGNVDFANPSLTPGDLAIYRTTFLAPDSWIKPIATSSPVQGDILTAVSYGRVSTPETGRLPQYDGLRLGWNGLALDGAAINVDDNFYGRMYFSSSSGVTLNGGGNNRDSGGFVYNDRGELVGAISSGNSSYTADPKFTYFSDYSTSGFIDQYSAYSGITSVPEPSNTALLMSAGLAAMAAAKKLKGRK